MGCDGQACRTPSSVPNHAYLATRRRRRSGARHQPGPAGPRARPAAAGTRTTSTPTRAPRRRSRPRCVTLPAPAGDRAAPRIRRDVQRRVPSTTGRPAQRRAGHRLPSLTTPRATLFSQDVHPDGTRRHRCGYDNVPAGHVVTNEFCVDLEHAVLHGRRNSANRSTAGAVTLTNAGAAVTVTLISGGASSYDCATHVPAVRAERAAGLAGAAPGADRRPADRLPGGRFVRVPDRPAVAAMPLAAPHPARTPGPHPAPATVGPCPTLPTRRSSRRRADAPADFFGWEAAGLGWLADGGAPAGGAAGASASGSSTNGTSCWTGSSQAPRDGRAPPRLRPRPGAHPRLRRRGVRRRTAGLVGRWLHRAATPCAAALLAVG